MSSVAMRDGEAGILVDDLQFRITHLQRAFGATRLRHIAKYQHHPFCIAGIPDNGGSRIGDRPLSSIFRDENRVVGKLNRFPFL